MPTGKFSEEFEANGDFICFKERLELWLLVQGIDEEDKKMSHLLTSLSIEVYKLLRNLCSPNAPSTKKYEEIILILEKQFVQKTIIFKERRKFYEASQMNGEKVIEFYNRVKSLAVNCDFGTALDDILMDRFVCGLEKGDIYEKLCESTVTEMNINKCVELAISKEASKGETLKVCNINRNEVKAGGQKLKCNTCGYASHKSKDCKYKDYSCRVCSEKGHLAKICKKRKRRTKRSHFVQHDDVIEQSEHEESGSEETKDLNSLDLFSIEKNNGRILNNNKNNNVIINNKIDFSCRFFSAILSINGISITFEIDTGSAISAIPYDLYKEKFASCELQKFSSTLKGYNGSIIDAVGCMCVNVTYEGKLHKVLLVVINGGCRPLLGRDIFNTLNFKICVNAINVEDELKILVNKYEEVFNGKLGEYVGEKICMKMKPDAKPIFVKPRPVPFAYKQKLECELDRLEQMGVITKIETANWGTPLVTVLKKDGSLRVCADYSLTANKFLEDVNHPLPKIEELFHALQGGQKYSKLDLSQAYHQLVLDDETRYILAWSTHKGLYAVNRMPYGCKPNSSIFQAIIEKVLLGCDGVVVFIDDIVVTGKSAKEHLENLKRVLEKLHKAGFKVNKAKCTFFENKINYLGYVIDAEGLHKDENKIEAIVKMPVPKTKTQIKALCGLINYYGRFIPNVSLILKPIYNLLTEENLTWSKECQIAMDKVKTCIVSDMVLVHYNPKLKIVLATDASSEGVGACLSHIMENSEKRPIAFASRTLSKAETNYSMVDKEALAIFYGVKKFAQYLLGRKFSIETDHKPLVAIFGNKKGLPSMSASRLQRWAIYLSNFDFDIKHIAGSENGGADALSRLMLNDSSVELDTNDKGSYLNFINNEFGRPLNTKDIASQIQIDPTLKKVFDFVKQGWPDKIKQEGEIKSYFMKRNELTLEKDIIMWGHRVIIPEKFRKTLLDEIHSTHIGIVKLKALARSFFWWPKMDSHIENLVNSCKICRENQNFPKKVEYESWPKSECALERIHLDFCGPIMNSNFLILIDSYSKWLELFRMKNLTAKATIKCLKEFFIQFGLPSTIVTDNAGTFVSAELDSFCKGNDIIHITSPPYHPPSNGQEENSVKTFKSALKKMVRDNSKGGNLDEKVQQFLYLNRNTVHSAINRTPFELMMFERIPKLRWSALKPKKTPVNDSTKNKRNNEKKFKVNDKIYFRNFASGKFQEGIILRTLGKNVYLLLSDDDREFKRHVNHIIPRVDDFYSKQEKVNLSSDATKISVGKDIQSGLKDILNEKIKYNRVDDASISLEVQLPREQSMTNEEPTETNRNSSNKEQSKNNNTTNKSIDPQTTHGEPSREKSTRLIKKPNKLNL